MNLKNIGAIFTILSIVLLAGCASSPKVQKTEKKYVCMNCPPAEQPQAESQRQQGYEDSVFQAARSAAQHHLMAERTWWGGVHGYCKTKHPTDREQCDYERCVVASARAREIPGTTIRMPASLFNRPLPKITACGNGFGRR